MTCKMAYLKVLKWCECILHVEYQKDRKTEAWVSLGVQFVSGGMEFATYADFGQPELV